MALITALKADDVERMNALLPDVNMRFNYVDDEYILIPLIHAAQIGSINCVTELIRRGVELDVKDVSGRTALNRAAYNGYDKCVEALLDAGAYVNGSDNYIPLTFAILGDHPKCAALLISAGSTLILGHINPLYAAVGKPWAIKMLLDAGVPLSSPLYTKYHPLERALEFGCIDSVRLLLGMWDNVDIIDRFAFINELQNKKCTALLLEQYTPAQIISNYKPMYIFRGTKNIDYCTCECGIECLFDEPAQHVCVCKCRYKSVAHRVIFKKISNLPHFITNDICACM